MSGVLRLAWRQLQYHRARSVVLALCALLVTVLPLTVNLLVGRYGSDLMRRADETPLVAGAKGSRYDLVLSALYFQGRVPDLTDEAERKTIDESGLARAIPLLARHTARERPIVGTTLDYLDFRGLRIARGRTLGLLGECVLGHDVAAELGLGPGDELLTDSEGAYDLSLRYPLRLQVVGVLAPSDSADDAAVFTDVRTTWIIEGVGHGHVEAGSASEDTVLRRDENGVVLNAATVEHQRITAENIDSFHFHGDPATFPLTSILVLPNDARSSTQIKGRYRVSRTAQLLVPSDVVEEVLGFVLRLKAFFDANVALVSVSTSLLLALIVLLVIRVRRAEFETLRRIGCSRGRIALMVTTEFAIVLGAGVIVAVGVAWTLSATLLP